MVVGRVNVGHSLPAVVTDDEARLAFVYLHCGKSAPLGSHRWEFGGGERVSWTTSWCASERKAKDLSANLRLGSALPTGASVSRSA